MKKIKLLSLILALLLVISVFTGCGNNDSEDEDDEDDEKTEQTEKNNDDDEEQNDNQDSSDTPAVTEKKEEETQKPEAQQPNTPQQGTIAEVGAILDAPEIKLDESVEDIYIYFTIPGTGDEETTSMELSISQFSDDMYGLYVSDGLLKLNEIVYEVTDTAITKYVKDVFMEKFVKDTEMSQTDIKAEFTETFSLLTMFIEPAAYLEGYKYKKANDTIAPLTGDAYVYELINDGKVEGKITIDKDTGIMVSLEDPDGRITVIDLKVKNIDFVDYK